MSPLVHYDVTHVPVSTIGNINSRTRQFILGYRLLNRNYVTTTFYAYTFTMHHCMFTSP
jgi:hypothetical protein